MAKKQSITVTVNDREYESLVSPRFLLCDYIREELELTGTHVSCSTGGCGSCTVLLDGKPVRSCLMLAVQADGRSIKTVESLGNEQELSPLQQAFHENHALQCGFCTPGFLISVTAFLEENPNPTDEEILEVLGGHLCRCTGYQNIILAVKAAAKKKAESLATA
jgi:aerobic-type carbon monoxide dehydrogenase small subunit (CoxS/CutS family)